jgi:hypothetical protein
MTWEMMEQSVLYQIENEIYYGASEPEPDYECPRFEYTFFIFTKYNPNSNQQWNIPDLEFDWQHVGSAWVGEWRENQYSGRGPIDNLYTNVAIVRNALENYKIRGILIDYKIRYRYPTYQW